jgi:hypothetical protein
MLEVIESRTVEALRRAQRVGDPVLTFWAAQWRTESAARRGDLEEMDRSLAVHGEMAAVLDQPVFTWGHAFVRSLRAQIAGDVDAAERLATEAFEIGTESGQPDAGLIFGAQMNIVAGQRGTQHELIPLIEQMAEGTPDIPRLFFASLLAKAHVEGGERKKASDYLAEFAAGGYELPMDQVWLTGMVDFAEAAIECGDAVHAAALFERLQPYAGQIPATGASALGPVSHYLGGLATVVALAARAAAELETATGIPSDTYASLTARIGRGERVITDRSVLIVDEAGMLGTRAVAKLLEAADTSGAKVVLVGDHRQLPEIEAGGAFAGLVNGEHRATTLSANRRQEAMWERVALNELRSGDVAAALASYERRGRLHLRADTREAVQTLVAEWFRGRDDGTATMLAVSRTDVEGLNERARVELRQRSLLGPDVVAAGGRSFALGDQVLCLRNDRRLGVRNGTRGTVVGATSTTVTISTDEGERRLPLRYVEEGRLGHAYATTIHKAQGATFDRAFVLATDTLYREAGYVALSRARTRTDLYLVEGAFGLGGRELGTQGEWVDELRRAMSESRAKRLASSYPASNEMPEPELVREPSALGRGR